MIRGEFQNVYQKSLLLTREGHLKQLAETNRHISTGMPWLDMLLKGGMKPGSVLEITGPPASGKTQLANTIAIHFCTQDRQCYYLDTKMDFSAIRAERVIRANVEETEVIGVLKRILVQRMFKLPMIIECVQYLLASSSVTNGGLLIIDSLSAPYTHYFGSDYREGQTVLEKLVKALRKLAITRKFIILVTTIPTKNGGMGGFWNSLPTQKISLNRVISDPDRMKDVVVHNDCRRVLTLQEDANETNKVGTKIVFSITDGGCVVKE